mmetsp:Transcript_128320/g.256288  ORF Transcript_128320/g.256288 Transcript_128320/m.256288 type:complete len:210 (-) Transcript_128320:219-848(-)
MPQPIQPLSTVALAVWPSERPLPGLRPVQVSALIHSTAWPGHPANAADLPIGPLTCISAPVGKTVGAFTVHLVPVELALIRDAVRRPVRAGAMFLPTHIFSIVTGTIWPAFRTYSKFPVTTPLSNIDAPICLFISTLTMGTILLPLPIIDGTAPSSCKSTMSMRPSLDEGALVAATISLLQSAFTMPCIMPPLSSVFGTLFYKSHGPPF